MLEQNLPLQYQLKQIFLEKIKKQEWKQGEKIPSEREICAQYQVSRITVREVLKDLEREGYFSRKQGKGTFVTLPKYVQKLNKFYSFREDMRKEGLKPSTTVLEFEEISCDNWLAGETGAAPGDKFFYITRLLMGGEEIYGYEISYIPGRRDLNFLSCQLSTNHCPSFGNNKKRRHYENYPPYSGAGQIYRILR